MNFAGIIQTALNVLLAGGLLGVWLKYLIENRKLSLVENEDNAERKRDHFDRALDVVTRQRDDALKLVADCYSRIEKLEMEVQGWRFARDLDPFPTWIIGLDDRHLYVNREFEKLFLEPTGRDYRDAIGEVPEGIWPESFCKTLRNLRDIARRVPDGRSRAVTNLFVGPNERQVTVQKFPIRIQGSIVAFAGYITDILAPDEISL